MVECYAEHISKLGWSLGRQPEMQAVGALIELQFGMTAEKGNVLHGFTADAGRERVNHRLSVCRPSESDGVKHISLGRETKVLRGILRRVRVVKCIPRRTFVSRPREM